MELTQGRKRMMLGGVAVVAACAAAVPFLSRIESLAASYRPVTRVALPNFTRVEIPGTPETADISAGAEVAAAPVVDETVAAALADTATETSGVRSPTAARPAPGGVIPVRFDLTSPGMGDEVVGGDEIVVRKTVRLGSRDLGSLPIHVDSRSRLLVKPNDLRAMLEQAGQGELASQTSESNELRTFSQLRREGVDLRYDPASDSVVVTIG